MKTSTNYIKIMAKGIVTGKHWKAEWDCVYSEHIVSIGGLADASSITDITKHT